MAKPLTWKLGTQIYSVELGSKVDKKALYGYAKKVVEREGRPLKRGYLCPDGTLLRHDEVALVKADPKGSPVEETITEIGGNTPELLPSSFEIETGLEGVPLSTLIGFNVKDAYPLINAPFPAGLYRTKFSYRKCFHYQEALVLAQKTESWLFVGGFKLTAFVGQTVVYDFFDSEDDADETEELDFAMV